MKNKTPAPNGRFYEMAAAAPQKRQCEFGSSVPARNSVKPPLHKAASTLSGFHAKVGSHFHAKIEPFDFDVDNPVLPTTTSAFVNTAALRSNIVYNTDLLNPKHSRRWYA